MCFIYGNKIKMKGDIKYNLKNIHCEYGGNIEKETCTLWHSTAENVSISFGFLRINAQGTE